MAMTSTAPGTATTEISTTQDGAIVPQNFRELRALAHDAAATRFYGANTPEMALLVMMTGRDLGLSYTQSLRAMCVVEGRVCMYADAMVAVCIQKRDVCEYFRCIEATSLTSTWETKRRGEEPKRFTFAFAEAEKAGLVKDKGNWVKWPARMCSARAKAFLARDVYPDLLMGLYDPDEIRDSRDHHEERPRPVIVESTIVPDKPRAQEHAERILAARSKAELDAAWAGVQAASKTKDLMSSEVETLKQTAAGRAAELKAAAMKAKQAEQAPAAVTHDADGVVVEAREPGSDG